MRNHFLQITEKYMRYYYSSKPNVIKTVTEQYILREDLEIPTAISSIKVVSCDIIKDELHKVSLEFCNRNYEMEMIEVTVGSEIEIELIEGNGDIYRKSLCTLKLLSESISKGECGNGYRK